MATVKIKRKHQLDKDQVRDEVQNLAARGGSTVDRARAQLLAEQVGEHWQAVQTEVDMQPPELIEEPPIV